jgi:hypothetical protein
MAILGLQIVVAVIRLELVTFEGILIMNMSTQPSYVSHGVVIDLVGRNNGLARGDFATAAQISPFAA